MANTDPKKKKMKLGDNVATKTLPQELVIEILLYLPVEYLWPLRFVCKTWHNLLISDPHFPKLHFNRSIQLKRNPSILATHKRPYSQNTNFYLATDHNSCDHFFNLHLPFPQDENNYIGYPICNGLLCLTHTRKNTLYIVNPLTKAHITVQFPLTPPRFPGYYTTKDFAFGFHQDQFKVVQVFGETAFKKCDFHSQVKVYTLGMNSNSSWRTVVEDNHYNMCFEDNHCPLINGHLHWLAKASGLLCIRMILALDLNDEVFKEILPPHDVDFEDRSTLNVIGDLRGLLCMFCMRHRRDVQIWVMGEYGVAHSWSKSFKIGQSEVGGVFHYLKPLGAFANNGDVVVVLQKNSKNLILYNTETRSIKNLKDFGFEFLNVHSYMGSIYSPRVIDGGGRIIT